jgi:cathepsin X
MKLIPSVHPFSEECSEIDQYPNATIAEYGAYTLDKDYTKDQLTEQVHKIQAEIFARGPVAVLVNGKALHEYHGGIFADCTASNVTTHVVSIVGWGHTTRTIVDDDNNDGEKEDLQMYWIVRNSWGEYWGEMGYFRILAGSNVLGIEWKAAWATPGYYSVENFFCREDGKNCNGSHDQKFGTQHYVDPSQNKEQVHRWQAA